MIMPQLIINTYVYVSLIYELKKNGKLFTSKFVWTGPWSYEKKNLPVRDLTKVEKHFCIVWSTKTKVIISGGKLRLFSLLRI